MNNGLTKENLLFILPPALKQDPSIMALAEAAAEALETRLAEIDRARVISNIDALDEAVLDILARDFKVDWWDPEYSIDEKRRTLKGSWRVHKTLGTKAAVETAISAIYPRTTVLEWFQYGGEPYHFRLDINITNDSIDSEKQRRVLERLNFYKSLRSHNDGVTYFVEAKPAIVKTAASVSSLEESAHVPLILPIPIIRPSASVRTGVATGLRESFSVKLNILTPAIKSTAQARAASLTNWGEIFTTRITLPDTPPPIGTATVRAAAACAWQESYTTGAVPLTEKVLAVTE